MEKYESKHQRIFRSVSEIYPLISDFSLLTPAVSDKVENWQATADACSFRIKGFDVRLRMTDKQENKHVKIQPEDGGIPVDFAFWIQLHEVSPGDTRMRLVLHADLNMMLKMMVGGKIQDGLDKAAESFAGLFNGTRA